MNYTIQRQNESYGPYPHPSPSAACSSRLRAITRAG